MKIETCWSCVSNAFLDRGRILMPTCEEVFFGSSLTLVSGSSTNSHTELGCSGESGFTLSGRSWRSDVSEPSSFTTLLVAIWRTSFFSEKYMFVEINTLHIENVGVQITSMLSFESFQLTIQTLTGRTSYRLGGAPVCSRERRGHPAFCSVLLPRVSALVPRRSGAGSVISVP